MKIRYILLLAFALTARYSHAQNAQITALQWSSNGCTEMHSNTPINVTTSIKTFPASSVVFERDGNSIAFPVTSIEGTWSDVSQPGTITYHVSYQNEPGLIRFERTATEFSIVIDFREASEEAMHQKMIVTNVSVIQ